ncbi:MAG: hypothetical protein AAGC77_12020 [Pseudomonadota bacterium]
MSYEVQNQTLKKAMREIEKIFDDDTDGEDARNKVAAANAASKAVKADLETRLSAVKLMKIDAKIAACAPKTAA